jgi:predicted RNase H-like HicB family nuclease
MTNSQRFSYQQINQRIGEAGYLPFLPITLINGNNTLTVSGLLETSTNRRIKMKEYVVIYEKGETNWCAIVPDLPGCISIGDTLEEVQENVKEAIELYLEVLAERGGEIPEPKTQIGTVKIAA